MNSSYRSLLETLAEAVFVAICVRLVLPHNVVSRPGGAVVLPGFAGAVLQVRIGGLERSGEAGIAGAGEITMFWRRGDADYAVTARHSLTLGRGRGERDEEEESVGC